MKVKIFKESNHDVLETKINYWLGMNNISVRSISSSSAENMGSINITVVIFYDSHE